VRDRGAHNLTPVDLIAGGIPCQPASLAGKRRGTEDDRWLWGEALRIVGEIRPTWVLFENPTGILSVQGGVPFESVLSYLEGLGYETGTAVIPACAVGAPHRRDRVWILAHTNGKPRRAKLTRQEWTPKVANGSAPMAHTASERRGTWWPEPAGQQRPSRSSNGSANVGYTAVAGLPDGPSVTLGGGTQGLAVLQPERSDWWAVEPSMGRVAHGVPRRVARLTALGNAVVPQLVEVIGRAILEADTLAEEVV